MLKHYGVDLASEWRSRRWRRLLNLIDHLPRDTYFMEAVGDDEDVARRWLRAQDEGASSQARAPRLSEWSPERDALERIADLLGGIAAINVAAAGGKPRAVEPAPRPQTAVDRVRRHDRLVAHRKLVSHFFPHGSPVVDLAVWAGANEGPDPAPVSADES